MSWLGDGGSGSGGRSGNWKQAGQNAYMNTYAEMLNRRANIQLLEPRSTRLHPEKLSIPNQRDQSPLNSVTWDTLQEYTPSLAVGRTDAEAYVNLAMSTRATESAKYQQEVKTRANVGNAFLNQPGSFSWSLFPVVYYLSNAGFTSDEGSDTAMSANEVIVVPFACVISPTAWAGTTFDDTRPTYKGVKMPAGGGGREFVMMMDQSFVSSDSLSGMAALASVASCASRYYSNDPQVFVTLAPWIEDKDSETFRAHMAASVGISPRNLTVKSAFAFDGPSLGLAVAAACFGLPPMMHTGYLSSFGESQIIKVNKTPYNGKKIQESLTIGRPMLGANLVCAVGEVDLKAMWAFSKGIPIVIPGPVNYSYNLVEQAAERAMQAASTYKRGNRDHPTYLKELGQDMEKMYSGANIPGWLKAAGYNGIFACPKDTDGTSYAIRGSLILGATNFSDVIRVNHIAASCLLRTDPIYDVSGVDYGLLENITERRVVKKQAQRAATRSKTKAEKAAGKPKAKKSVASKEKKKLKKSVTKGKDGKKRVKAKTLKRMTPARKRAAAKQKAKTAAKKAEREAAKAAEAGSGLLPGFPDYTLWGGDDDDDDDDITFPTRQLPQTFDDPLEMGTRRERDDYELAQPAKSSYSFQTRQPAKGTSRYTAGMRKFVHKGGKTELSPRMAPIRTKRVGSPLPADQPLLGNRRGRGEAAAIGRINRTLRNDLWKSLPGGQDWYDATQLKPAQVAGQMRLDDPAMRAKMDAGLAKYKAAKRAEMARRKKK